MMTSDESAPPATMTVAIRIPRMYPTPTRAGETLTATAALNGKAIWNFPATTLKPSVSSLKSIPAPMPAKTGAACWPPPSAATSTSAQASPSG